MVITYNHGRYIAQALESVLMQRTNFHFTINVIEDCSTDDTADIIRDYAARYPDRVVPFLNEKNIGFKATQKNFVRGFQTLNGEYFAILEGDDYWTSPEKLQKQVDFLDRNSDYAICAHNTIKLYDDGSQEPHRFLYYGKQEDGTIEDAISMRMFFHTTGVLYRNVFNGVPPQQYISKWSCDIFVVISHAAHGRIRHIDEDMAVYRAHAGGRFSTMSKLDGWKFNIGGLQRYNAWLGFRFMKPFAKAIATYCHLILTESGTAEVARLSAAERCKYAALKYLYRTIYKCCDVPNRISRALMLASIGLRRRLTWHLIQAGQARQWAARADRSAGLAEHWSASSPSGRLPIGLRCERLLLSIIDRLLKLKISAVRLPGIESFGPRTVKPGECFNVQADGQSALWMRVATPPPAGVKLIVRGTALLTVAADRIVTANVPAWLTVKPGKIPFWLECDDIDGMRVSEPAYLEVATVRPAHGAVSPRLCVERFGPQPVAHGQLFNVQGDGHSAIWLQLEQPPPPHTSLVFGGIALPTVVEDRVVTALVPADLTAQPGLTPIWLEATGVGGAMFSEMVYFETV